MYPFTLMVTGSYHRQFFQDNKERAEDYNLYVFLHKSLLLWPFITTAVVMNGHKI